jgi:SAM-dependent methyltransferase
VGIDLSPGMVALARTRAAGRPRVRVLVGDAATLDPAWTRRCGAVVSVFGLQQLPDPPLAVQSWRSALAPGGVLCVMYWPGVTESAGPFALLGGRSAPYPWESALGSAFLERDEFRSYPMTHPDAATFFHEYVHNGPMRSTPPAVVDALRPEFLRRAPSGPWTHYPRARLMVWRLPRDGTGAAAGSA